MATRSRRAARKSRPGSAGPARKTSHAAAQASTLPELPHQGEVMNIPRDGALDFVSLGALIHRLDPGIIPFRKATECQIHVSGGEFNVAANLADCFGLNTGVATAMVKYPIGDLVAERVKAMGVRPFYKMFEHDG